MPVKSKAKEEAIALGLDRYFTGKPCKSGHMSARYINNGGCVQCACDRTKSWYVKNKKSAREYIVRYRKENRETIREIQQRWRDKNKHKISEKHRIDRYGITDADYENILRSQDNSCAICESTSPGTKHVRFDIDHSHQTGEVRGLLCHKCNLMLGCSKDSPDVLRRGAEYLEKQKQVMKEAA